VIRLDVPVPNVAAAIAFYARAFDVVPSSPDTSGARELGVGGVVLRVCDETTHVPGGSDPRFYQKGSTPRLEVRVEDVDAAVACAVNAGAKEVVRLPSADGSPGPGYAQVLDPFGHLWSLTSQNLEPLATDRLR
jgi:PhnB protein